MALARMFRMLWRLREFGNRRTRYSDNDTVDYRFTVSGPRDVQKCKEMFGEDCVKIDCFSQICLEKYNLRRLRQQQMSVIIFQVLTNQNVRFYDIALSIQRHFRNWSILDELIFLLLDDASEAIAQCHRTVSSAEQSLVTIFLSGREKGIYQWDLNVLSAICLIIGSVARLFQIPISDSITHVDEFKMDPGMDIEESMVKQLVYWCIKVKGNEQIFFNPFRIKMHDLFSHSDAHHRSILNELHLKFYGKALLFDKQMVSQNIPVV